VRFVAMVRGIAEHREARDRRRGVVWISEPAQHGC